MFTELARIADNSSDESLDEAIADVQMEALVEMMPEEVMVEEMMAEESDADVQMEAVAEVIEGLEVQAINAQVLQMTPEQLKHVDMTREELEYLLAHCCQQELEEIDCGQEVSVEEIFLSKADLMDLLTYNMEAVGDSIKEFPAFMTFLIENGLYMEVDQAPVANDEAPVAQVTSEAKNSNTRQKTSVLISRLKDVIKTGKKRNSNVALDEEEIEHHRKMLKTIEKAGHVLFRILM